MTSITIASWNVNSIRARLELLVSWLKEAKPDIVLIQELKALEEVIPKEEINALNYNYAIKGQKAYNGVAILSKYPISDIKYSLPTLEDDIQSRYIEGWVDFGNLGFRVASIYAPNGNPIFSEKYDYKIKWLNAFKEYSQQLLKYEENLVLGGDYNICPSKLDAANEDLILEDAIYQKEIKTIYREIINSGYTDSFRCLYPEKQDFTYWDYGKAFLNNLGVRIDHLLLSSLATDKCTKIHIDKKPRGKMKPSDHTPIIGTFSI